MTAKLCRRGVHIREVAVSYNPRGAAAGKKIGWRDAVQTVTTLIYWRLASLEGRPFRQGLRKGFLRTVQP